MTWYRTKIGKRLKQTFWEKKVEKVTKIHHNKVDEMNENKFIVEQKKDRSEKKERSELFCKKP